MASFYCKSCQHGLDPTTVERFTGEAYCGECHTMNETPFNQSSEVIEEFEDRITDLESIIVSMSEKISELEKLINGA